ncbi:MAG TPA: hypothetical protein VK923_01455 [Euzebyales bacterium]|nr:hypothetical protein [Euzebyales bacterium]
MQFDKQQVLDLMQSQREPGDPGQADQVRDELPQEVDTDHPEHQSLLEQLGIEPQDLIGKLGGGSFGL